MNRQRMCSVCRNRFDKYDLIRVYKDKSGNVCLDRNGKADGRGLYICKDRKCIENASKRRVIERAFGADADTKIYSEIFEVVCDAK